MSSKNYEREQVTKEIYAKALQLEQSALAGEIIPEDIIVMRGTSFDDKDLLKLEIVDGDEDQHTSALLEFGPSGKLVNAWVVGHEYDSSRPLARISGRRLDGFLQMVLSSLPTDT